MNQEYNLYINKTQACVYFNIILPFFSDTYKSQPIKNYVKSSN